MSDAPTMTTETTPPRVDLPTLTDLLAGYYAEVQQIAATLDDDGPTKAEETDPQAYAMRLQTLVELRSDDAVSAAENVLAAVLAADALPWSSTWFSAGSATKVYGLMRQGVAYREAVKRLAASVSTMAELGLYQAAWYKTSDALHFAGLFFQTVTEMVRLIRD